MKETESFGDRRTYTLARDSIGSLATAFKGLEATKRGHAIEEYSFGQNTLEQVFIEFAKQQMEAERKEEEEEGTVRVSHV